METRQNKGVIAPLDPRLVYMPEADVLSASGIAKIIRLHWWVVHPQEGLIFWQSDRKRYGQLRSASPQCNRDKSIAEAILQKMYPWAELKLLPLVLHSIDIREYY